jgi:hypothetical protein
VTSRSARMSNLRRDAYWLKFRQQGPILDYWRLLFPTLFNELHRESPACIRSEFKTPVETFRPHERAKPIIDVSKRPGQATRLTSSSILTACMSVIYTVTSEFVETDLARARGVGL